MVSNRLMFAVERIALLGCLAVAACSPTPQHTRPAPEVGVVVIQAQPVQLTTVLPGRTSPFATSDIRPQVNGILQARLFKEGDTVKAGQPLYQIDPALYRAAYDNALAALATAKAKATRYDMLIKADAVAPQDNDDVQAAYKQVLANVETAKINLDYTRIVAPISGRIGRSAFTEGALVTADQTTALATIQTLDPIYVDITQSSSELLNLKMEMQGGRLTQNGPGDARVTLLLDNGTGICATGRPPIQRSDRRREHRRSDLARHLSQSQLLTFARGMFVRATIIEGVQRNAILAPQQGVSRDKKAIHRLCRRRAWHRATAVADDAARDRRQMARDARASAR